MLLDVNNNEILFLTIRQTKLGLKFTAFQPLLIRILKATIRLLMENIRLCNYILPCGELKTF